MDDRGVVLKNKRLGIETEGYSDPGLGPNSIELRQFLEEWIAALTMQLDGRC